jgi:tRNA pseudouridine55 synthase
MTAASGLVIVAKPAGMTSHDVVARIRRLAGTRRVGHAGTLDPMATGVLVVGVEKATRLLGHLTLADKDYLATIRLGQATDTDDAEGTVISATGAADVSEAAVRAAVVPLTGDIQQVPPGVSAIKVGGQRAYRLTRAGAEMLDVDTAVTCSSGTYIRALARDLGAALGVGGHLTALRRVRSGSYRIEAARTLDELAAHFAVTPLAEAAAAAFPRLDLTEDEARRVAHGARLPAAVLPAGPGPAAVFGPDGALIALMREEEGQGRPLAVFVP